MAGSNKYSHYTNVALQYYNFFYKISQYNTDWFDEITRTEVILKITFLFQEVQKHVKYFFSLGNYEEKAILNGL